MVSFKAHFSRLVATFAMVAMVGAVSLTAQVAKADVVITTGADKKVKIWDPANGKEIKSIDAHDSEITAVNVSTDGKLLATGGADKKVKIWKVENGELVKEIAAHDGAVTAISFSDDGKMLATGSADKKIKLWTLPDGKLDSTIEACSDKVVGVGLIEFNGMLIILAGSADGVLPILGKDGNALVQFNTEHKGGLTVMGGNRKEQCVYSGGADGVLKFWGQMGNGEFEGGKHGGAMTGLIATAEFTKIITSGLDGKIMIWSASDHKRLAEVDTGLKGGVTAVAASPDGKLIFTGGDKVVKVWDGTGKEVHSAEAHAGKVTGILYVADKKEDKK
jgi:WD40 repeat protein